jgi:hypothetical protein
MPRYKCPHCKKRYKSTVPGNFTCPTWTCANVALAPYTGAKTKGFTLLGKATEKFDAQKKQRDIRISSLRSIPKPKAPKPELDPNDFDDPLEYKATLDLLKDVEDKELEKDASDFDFVPNATRWEFDQRLTVGDMAARAHFPHGMVSLKKSGFVTIAAPVAGEREKQCCSIMGNHLGVKSISAHGASNQIGSPIGKKWTLGEKDTAEWCHLVGVSLGGYTKAANLVSASYCANTFMGVIEKFVQARTDLDVAIEILGVVHANKALAEVSRHVAEVIIYEIFDHMVGTKKAKFVIDARINGFSTKDRDAVQTDLKNNIPAMKKF